ncbi:MAG: glycosyltransferase family 2 protein [Gallionellaceae bacterium]|jgi:glycosyltransferase involved in cell wall biosynthesis
MSHNSLPLISIIVAVYNGAKTLQQCIDSVSHQTYLSKELIIVDGGSLDGTVKLLGGNNDQISYWISEPDKGIYNAWNKGLLQAKGDWICFLGADDYFWDEKVLEHMVDSLQKLPSEIRVAYGQVMLVDANRKNLHAIGKPWGKIKERFKKIMCIPHPGSMHHKSLFQEFGQYDESFRIAADYELLLRELKTKDAFYFPDLITVGMMQGGISSDPENSLSSLREIRRAQIINGIYMPSWVWLLAIARVYVRLLMWRVLGESWAKKALDLYRHIGQKG